MSSAGEGVPKVKYAEGANIGQQQLNFMKVIEKQNFERVKRLQKTRRNNLITAGVLGAGVLGIYAYSMLSVQQEKFLDDFEEPKKVELSNKN